MNTEVNTEAAEEAASVTEEAEGAEVAEEEEGAEVETEVADQADPEEMTKNGFPSPNSGDSLRADTSNLLKKSIPTPSP